MKINNENEKNMLHFIFHANILHIKFHGYMQWKTISM